jgi:hypothetical protein
MVPHHRYHIDNHFYLSHAHTSKPPPPNSPITLQGSRPRVACKRVRVRSFLLRRGSDPLPGGVYMYGGRVAAQAPARTTTTKHEELHRVEVLRTRVCA